MTLTRDTAETWLKKYGQTWEGADPRRAAELFSEDCRYYETPFSEPAVGRDAVRSYWQAVPEGQTDVRFSFRILAVQSPAVIAHWSASFTRVSTRARVRLDGVFLLEFADSGLCSSLREWWHREETPQR
jgi:hypothetical protein